MVMDSKHTHIMVSIFISKNFFFEYIFYILKNLYIYILLFLYILYIIISYAIT